MTRMDVEEQEVHEVHEEAFPGTVPFPSAREFAEHPARTRSVAGVLLGTIALILALALGVLGLWFSARLGGKTGASHR